MHAKKTSTITDFNTVCETENHYVDGSHYSDLGMDRKGIEKEKSNKTHLLSFAFCLRTLWGMIRRTFIIFIHSAFITG